MHGKKNMGAIPSLYPTPLVLCGTYDADGRPNVATVAWAGICCGTPPAIQVSLRKSRHTYAAIAARRAFTVNIPSTRQAEQADFCGIASGKNTDKFGQARLTPRRGEFVDAPLVQEFPVCMECRLLHTIEIGSHDLFVGEIVASWVAEECLGEDGAPNPTKIDPVVFAPVDGYYYSLGFSLGKAFDIGKFFMEEGK